MISKEIVLVQLKFIKKMLPCLKISGICLPMAKTQKRPGRPRLPKRARKTRTGITLPPEVAKEARKEAAHMGISMSAFICIAIQQELLRCQSLNIVL